MVNDCYAHNGANKRIQLIDHHGCPIDEKLISRFQGTWGMTDNMYDTLIYAHMKTFRFTGTPALYIECDIRMCHGKCPVSSFHLLSKTPILEYFCCGPKFLLHKSPRIWNIKISHMEYLFPFFVTNLTFLGCEKF